MEISNFYLEWVDNSKFICIHFCLFLVYRSKFSGGSAAQAMIQS